jgi:hypothetical protein
VRGTGHGIDDEELVAVAKIRDTATVILVNGVPKVRKGGVRNASRSSAVTRSTVNQEVLKYAMNLVGNDISRLKIVNETTIEILPER